MASNYGTNETEKPSEQKLKYPKSVFVIIGNEFCERFSYYGLRTILTIYLTQRLYYSENISTMIFHAFTTLAYFSPLFGAIIADSFLGKYRTILYLSILYACGCIILSIGAYPTEINTMVTMTITGLFVIALGTGGIKPCVSAFGGDQFKQGQEKQLQNFFSVFYLAINLGSVFSTYLTPILRADVQCFGEETCYALAFGVPCVLMIVALIIFIAGKPLYTIRPPEGNIVVKVSKCICYALSRKCKSSEKKKSHWLDYADDKFDKKLIGDIKILLKVLVLYIPLPLFWALFDQQASRWTLQATRMDGKIKGFHIKADQMQVINPLLIIIFIPFFNYILYPVLDKCHLLRSPLQRITTGGILAAISFVVAGLLELNLEDALPVDPGSSQLTIINNSPCSVKIDGFNISTIDAFETAAGIEIPIGNQSEWIFTPNNCTTTKPKPFSFFSNASIETMMITLQNDNLEIMKGNDTKDRLKSGEPQVRVFYSIDPPENSNISFLLKSENGKNIEILTDNSEGIGMTKYVAFTPGRYKIYLKYNVTAYQKTPVLEETFKSGGIYIVNIYEKSGYSKQFTYRMVKESEVSILLQIPQYIIITAGEIMFSVTGLEFSYSQSPNSMKSVVQAAWLLTVAFGNLLVLIVVDLHLFQRQSYELFFFASLMVVDMMIFAILAYFYKYVTIKTPSQEEVEIAATTNKRHESQGRSNEAYDEDKF